MCLKLAATEAAFFTGVKWVADAEGPRSSIGISSMPSREMYCCWGALGAGSGMVEGYESWYRGIVRLAVPARTIDLGGFLAVSGGKSARADYPCRFLFWSCSRARNDQAVVPPAERSCVDANFEMMRSPWLLRRGVVALLVPLVFLFQMAGGRMRGMAVAPISHQECHTDLGVYVYCMGRLIPLRRDSFGPKNHAAMPAR